MAMSRCMLLTRTLSPVATLDSAIRIAYELKHNDLNTAEIQLATADPVAALCTAFSAVHLWDGDRDLGLYRVSASPASDVWSGGTVTYTLEHMLSTLLDDVIFDAIEMADVPFGDAIRQLLGLQSDARWVLGDCDFDVPISDAFGSETILAAIKKACGHLQEAYTWHYDTASQPHVLHIRRADADAGCGIHYGRSMVGITREMDASGVVTRLYLLGGADAEGKQVDVTGLTAGGVPYIDADTIGEYGIRAAIYQSGDITDPAVLLAKGQAILDAKKDPVYTYQATALDLHRLTGYAWDLYEPGKLVTVTDDDRGIRFSARIISVAKQDATGDPGSITVTIASQQPDELGTLTAVAQMAQSAQSSGIQNAANIAINAINIDINAKNIMANADTIALNARNVQLILSGLTDTLTAQAETINLIAADLNVAAENINVNATNIDINAKKIAILADLIQLNADRIELNAKEIVANADLIQLNADRIELNAQEILLKASKETVDEMGTRLSQAEINIDGANARIDLKASQSLVDELSSRLSQAEINIDGANARIDLKASQEVVDDLSTRLSQAEIDIDGANAAITMKASQTTVDELGEKVTSAELRIDGAESAITAKADTVRVEAIETTITGLVTMEEFQSVQGWTTIFQGGSVTANYFNGENAYFSVLNGGTINGLDLKSSTLTIGDKSCTFYAPADATFDLSDMPGYDDALDAARTEGASSVSVSSLDVWGETYSKTYKTVSASVDVILSTNATSQHSISVDASKAYSAGESAGYSDGYSSGESAGYSDGYSSGESAGYSSGYSSGYSAGESKGYSDGYGDGLVDGYSDGKSAGYDEGYSAGETAGKSAGYNEGYSAGETAGKSAGYNEGYSAGETAGKTAGYNEGYSAGETAGKSAGYDEGYAAAKDKYYDERGTWSDGYEEGALKGYDTGYSAGKASVSLDYVSFAYETAGSLYVFVYLTNGYGVTTSVEGY